MADSGKCATWAAIWNRVELPKVPSLVEDVQRFPGWLVFKAHRLLFDSTLGLRVIKNKRREDLLRTQLFPASTIHKRTERKLEGREVCDVLQ